MCVVLLVFILNENFEIFQNKLKETKIVHICTYFYYIQISYLYDNNIIVVI